LYLSSALYEVIEAAEGIDETSLPQEAYVPGAHEGSQLPVNATTTAPGGVAAGYAVGGGAGSAPHETVFDAGKEGH